MHLQLTVWGTKDLIAAITENYYSPKICQLSEFDDYFKNIIPKTVVHPNHYVGAAGSCYPVISNLLLVGEGFTCLQQPIDPCPEGYSLDTSAAYRAKERFKFEVLPAMKNESFNDFMIVINIHMHSMVGTDLIDHFDSCLRAMSPEHCFGWHMITDYALQNTFRQALCIRKPDLITLPPHQSLSHCDSDLTVTSLIEHVYPNWSPNVELSEFGDFITVAEALKLDATKLLNLIEISEEAHVKIYWPTHITPEALKFLIDDFFHERTPYISHVEFTENNHKYFILPV